MNINNDLTNSKTQLKYFYTHFSDSESILYNDRDTGILHIDYLDKKGSIIVDIINNITNLLFTIEKCNNYIQKKINKNDNEHIFKSLNTLGLELTEYSKFFKYVDFKNLYYKQYQNEINNDLSHNNISNELDYDDICNEFGPIKIETDAFKEFVINKLFDLHSYLKNLKKVYSLLIHNDYYVVDPSETETKSEEFFPLYLYNISTYNNLKVHSEIVEFRNNMLDFDSTFISISYKKSKKTDYKLIQYFEFYDITDLINLSLAECSNSEVKINHCINCGKYFLPLQRSDEKYCYNISPQKNDKTCKDIGANEKLKKKIKSNSIEREHHNAKTYFNMNKTRAKTDAERAKIENIYNSYKIQFKKQLKKYENKEITEKEFIKWIVDQKHIS